MKLLDQLKNTIKMGDFFNSYQMLRYEHQTEYRTFTGGLISLAIIITIIIGFASMIIDTMNRTIINFTQNFQRQVDPTLSSITITPNGDFMFGVEVWGYNLSSQQRYFDIKFTQISSNYGENYTYTDLPLQTCTKQHWDMLPYVVANYDRLRVGNWLCPTFNTIINLQGKYSSPYYQQYSVTLYPCNNNTDPNRFCAPQSQIDDFLASNGQWNYFSYYFVNSRINPDQPTYKSLYLQDRNWIVFGNKLGAELDLYLSEININSDNSIWPFTSITYSKSYSVEFNPIIYPFTVDNTTSYATFYIMKDPTNLSYNRAVQKIFVVFSFMGGLIGAVMAGLFIIDTYTSFAFELALAIDIFKDAQESNTHKALKHQSEGSINILQFIKYHIYQVLKKFMPNLDWPFIEYIHQCRQQILYQLDIKGLIKRIIFIEYSISYILEDYHLSEMHNQKPYLPADVKALRQKFQSAQLSDAESLSQNKSIESKKPFCKQRDHIVDSHNGLATNEQFASARNHQDVNPSEIFQEQKLNIQFTNSISIPKFQSQQQNVLRRKKTENIRKIRKSAEQGNLISKKLLDIIQNRAPSEIEGIIELESKMFGIKSSKK